MAIRLSLAVAAARADPAEVGRFLAALPGAGLEPQDEVCLAAAAAGAEARELRERVAGLSGVSLSLHREESTPMRLWGSAMARARGTHVAALEAGGVPAAGWARAWARAPRDRIVYGPVNPGPLRGAWSWAAYLGDYGQFHQPLEGPGTGEVPGNNVVFPRDLLPPRSVLEERGFWKTFHLERLRRLRGPLPLAVAEEMAVSLARGLRPGPFLARRFLHGRCYGGSRLEEPGAPPRLLCLAFAPLLPALRGARVLWRIRRKPLPALRVAAALPALALGEIAWSLGELSGYARGAGDACERLF
jgi:hypothetical protein